MSEEISAEIPEEISENITYMDQFLVGKIKELAEGFLKEDKSPSVRRLSDGKGHLVIKDVPQLTIFESPSKHIVVDPLMGKTVDKLIFNGGSISRVTESTEDDYPYLAPIIGVVEMRNLRRRWEDSTRVNDPSQRHRLVLNVL